MEESINVEALSAKKLPEALASKAERELNENVLTKANDIREFRELVIGQSDLKSRIDDNFLLRFLRAKKFDKQKALMMVRNYYKQREKYPELYENLLASSFTHEVLSNFNLGVLAGKDNEGRTIYVFNTASLWDPSVLSVDDCIRYSFLSFECIIQDEEAQVNGIVCILDCSGFGLKHLMALSPFHMAKIVSIFLNSFPFRFKGAHAIHTPTFFKIAFSLFKQFLSKKLKERFCLYGDDLTLLHERLRPDILPKEFGGKLGLFSNSYWSGQLEENDKVMQWNAKFGYVSDST